MNYEHKIVKCLVCGAVVMQCRCFAPDKFVQWVTCAACAQKPLRNG